MSLTLEELKHVFTQQFGHTSEYHFRAPGRVNLIGEHTDYNDGFVLPCAIDFETNVIARPNGRNQIRVLAADYYHQVDCIELGQEIVHHHEFQWANYVRGVTKSLQARKVKIVGCDLAISGNVPKGAGLSSSAALEVALGMALSTLSHHDLSKSEIALNGQQAENEFVGCNSGIMDQLVSAQGQQGNALLIDCRSLACMPVQIPDSLSVMIINSNVKRGLVDSEYNTRRIQCETGADLCNVPSLRDLSEAQFARFEGQIDDVIAKRVRHVVSENTRTKAAAIALEKADIKTLSTLMAESHISMRDDFEITVPQIDFLVELIGGIITDTGGVRMTGGGFGGCVVALVPHDKVRQVTESIAVHYPTRTGLNADVFVCRPCAGAEIVVQP